LGTLAIFFAIQAIPRGTTAGRGAQKRNSKRVGVKRSWLIGGVEKGPVNTIDNAEKGESHNEKIFLYNRRVVVRSSSVISEGQS